MDFARRLLLESLDPKEADRILQSVGTQLQGTPFAFLQQAEASHVLAFIQDEHPQTIALVLSHLPSHKAGEILAGLPASRQLEVVKRIANMEQTHPEIITEVERGLRSRLAAMLGQTSERIGGAGTVAEILNLVDRTTERSILEGVESDDADLAEAIRRLMFVFEDILLVDDRGLQAVLKEIDNAELALALKTASPPLQERLFTNLSERAARMIQEEMQYMGPVRISDVERAQQRIVDVVRKLEESGDVIVRRGNGEEDLVG